MIVYYLGWTCLAPACIIAGASLCRDLARAWRHVLPHARPVWTAISTLYADGEVRRG